MNRTWLFLLLIILIDKNVYSNAGGATEKPGMIGSPIVWQLADISVTKEDLDLKFYEDNNKRYCRFTAVYYFKSNIDTVLNITGIFYSKKSSSIEIESNNMDSKYLIDSTSLKNIDSLINQKSNRGGLYYWDWKNAIKTGFRITYDSKSDNKMIVKGVVELEPTQYWYSWASPSTYTRHPFLNKKAGEGSYSMDYIVSPIKSWKSVGDINVSIELPSNWIMTSNISKVLTIQHNDSIKGCQLYKGILNNELPTTIFVSIDKPSQLYIGGLSVGFNKINSNSFSNRYSWEFGYYNKHWSNWMVNIIGIVDYETDYKTYNQICATVMPSTPEMTLIIPSIGLGFGMPVRFQNNRTYVGFRFRVDYYWTLFGISIAWDTFNILNKDYKTTYYQLSL